MSYTYLEPINDNLICCICRAPFIDPCTTRTCTHTFCQQCIITALAVSPHCPVDRSLLSPEDLTLADPLIRNLVNELLVECPNRAAGCKATPQRQLLDIHVRESCKYLHSATEDTAVELDPLANEVSEGCISELSTGESSTTCCHLCKQKVLRSSLDYHISACGDTVVSCTHAANGCPWEGRRLDFLSVHIPSCSYEAIKGFFAVHERQLSSIKTENDILKQRVAELEGLVRVLTRECSIMKDVLGPWYEADTRCPPPVTLLSAQSYTNRSAESSARNPPSSSVSPTIRLDDNPVGQHITTDQLDSLASYFPPMEEDDTNPSLPQRVPESHPVDSVTRSSGLYINRSVPFSNPIVNYHAGLYSGPSPPHQSQPPPLPLSTTSIPSAVLPSSTITPTSPIAPLNLSGSLLGTLSSLHNSVISLSSSVDALARQHEVHIATEAMRNTEELRGLRTVLHGVRMQMHSIMMDRNAQYTGRPPTGMEGPPGSPPTDGREGPWPLPPPMPFALPRFPHSGGPPPAPVTKL